MIKKILNFLFPPLSQLAVFVFSVTLISMVFYVDTLSSAAVWLLKAAAIISSDWLQDARNLIAKLVLGMILLSAALGVLVLVFAPLVSPFTKKDLRRPCTFTLFIDAVILIVANAMGAEAHPLIGSLIVIYALAWIFFIDLTSSSRRFDMLISNVRTSPQVALSVGAFAIALAFILNQLFHVWWANAYLFATASTLLLVQLIKASYRSWYEGTARP